jgi:hypothetical protein
VDLDEAYWQAVEEAGGVWGTAPIAFNYWEWFGLSVRYKDIPLAGEPRALNSAYQHFLAALKAGIDEVGLEVFGQALVDLGWSSVDDVDRVSAYFRGSKQSVRIVARYIGYGDWALIYRGACEAACLSMMWAGRGKFKHYRGQELPVWVRERNLVGSQLEWLLKIPPWFGRAADIHHAMMADEDFAESVHEFLALPEQPCA